MTVHAEIFPTQPEQLPTCESAAAKDHKEAPHLVHITPEQEVAWSCWIQAGKAAHERLCSDDTLDEDERARLLGEVAAGNQARKMFIETTLGLASYLARNFHNPAFDRDDFEQIARYGLIKAVDGFDGSKGFRFTTFATPTIQGEVRRAIRDKSQMIRIPRDISESMPAIFKVRGELEALGREPTAEEIAAQSGVSLEAAEYFQRPPIGSLDVIHSDDGLPLSASLADSTLPAAEELAEQSVQAEELHTLLNDFVCRGILTEREKWILELRYLGEEEMTQSVVGKEVGLSQMQISRILRGALEKLRAALDPADFE